MKILVIQQKMIGDVLTSSILFEALRLNYPSAQLHYLIHEHTKPVVENNPFIDKLILFNPEEDSKTFNFLKFLNKIRKEQYDVMIDVYSKNSSALISFASKAKVRIGQNKWYLQWAYTYYANLSAEAPFDIPIAFYNRLEFLKPLDLYIDFKLAPKIFVLEEERIILKKKLQEQNISTDQELVMVNCLGSDSTKTYPLNYMARFLDEFIALYPNKKLFFNYIPKQIGEVEQLINSCKRETQEAILDFYAPSLREFVVLTSFCEAVIGNEGGATNIGKALGLKTFAIFSPWINKASWGHTNNKDFINVHLKDYHPKMFEGKTRKEIKNEISLFYQTFPPQLFHNKLQGFL